MSLTYAIKRGDTYPSVRLDVTNYALLPAMAGASVQFIAKSRTTDVDDINEAGSFESPRTLVYEWGSGETDHVAEFDAEFEVTLAAGAGVFTLPGVNSAGVAQYIRVKIVEDLGDVEAAP